MKTLTKVFKQKKLNKNIKEKYTSIHAAKNTHGKSGGNDLEGAVWALYEISPLPL